VTAPANQPGLRTLGQKGLHMLSVEQYLLAACIDYRTYHSAQQDGRIHYLFDSPGDSSNPARLARLGYTHLAAGAKRHPHLARQLQRRVYRDYPHFYARCNDLTTHQFK
jgi:hypothetical protein